MMATGSMSQDPVESIIVLGNAGAGKSFICNLLIGKERFQTVFATQAATTLTEHDRGSDGAKEYQIYNVPGLIDSNQERINDNKHQINKAFEQRPMAVVIFVWTQRGGRAMYEDIIAFKALDEAYDFPCQSLVHIVNNISPDRPNAYDSEFVEKLSNFIGPTKIFLKNTFFLPRLDDKDEPSFHENRKKLYSLIGQHGACKQRGPQNIVLYRDQINTLKSALKRQEGEFETEKQRLEDILKRMGTAHENIKEEAQKQLDKMLSERDEMNRRAQENRYSLEREVILATFQQKLAACDKEHAIEIENVTAKYHKKRMDLFLQLQSLFDNARASRETP